jgi:pilus assembly protein Flp/PilA
MRRTLVSMHAAVAAWYTGMALERRRDRGATAVEYGLIVALIAVVIIVAVALFGSAISASFNRSATTIPT